MMNFNMKEIHFAGHQTFPLRHIWLTKAYELYDQQGEKALRNDEKIMMHLGVGLNMAKSLKHWCESTQIFEKSGALGYTLTQTGSEIFSSASGDKYLERLDTIWLIHYLLVTNHKKNALWFYVFNVFNGNTIHKDQLISNIKSWCTGNSIRVSDNTIERDFNCFINMYNSEYTRSKSSLESLLVSPFRELKILESFNGTFQLRTMLSKEISRHLFAFCMLEYLERQENQKSIPLSNILLDIKSPGRVFRMSEDVLVDYLEDFIKKSNTYDVFSFDSTAGMKQLIVNKKSNLSKYKFLKRLFKEA